MSKFKDTVPLSKGISYKYQILLIVLTFVVYGNTTFNNYCLDDEIVVTENPYVKRGFSGIVNILTHHYLVINDEKFEYRPIAEISLAIEYQFFGLNPHVSHFINIVLYAVLILLLFKLLQFLFNERKSNYNIPLLIAVFYTIHPAHTEVVASIKNREEILSIIFAVASINYFIKAFTENKLKWLIIISFLLFFLSLMSKVTAIYLPAILLAFGIYLGFYEKQKRTFIYAIVCFFLLSIVYFGLIWGISNRTIQYYENPLILEQDWLVKLGSGLRTLLFYLKFQLLPYPFRFFYGYNVIPMVKLFSPLALLSLIIHFAIGWFVFKKKGLSCVLAICYFISIALYSNLLLVYTGIVSERVLFFPSFWFLAFVFSVFAEFTIKEPYKKLSKYATYIILSTFFMFFTISAIARNFQWKNKLSLMENDIKFLKNSMVANMIYANTLEKEAEINTDTDKQSILIRKAISAYKQSIVVGNKNPVSFFRLGVIYGYWLNNLDSAIYFAEKAISLDSNYNEAKFQLAKAYFYKKDLNKSELLFSNLNNIHPNDTLNLFFYAQVLNDLGKTDKALNTADRLIKMFPNLYYGYMTKGVIYQKSNNLDLAIPLLEKSIELGGNDQYVKQILTKYYLSKGNFEKLGKLKEDK